ncbi:MAG: amino acid ABC transporter permease [Acetobacteraceae bacterium]|nr:amino acid ABC transporter permease [Acetobacteraceae bacterium]
MSAFEMLLEEAPRFFTWWNVIFLLRAAANTLLLSVIGCAAGYLAGFTIATLRLDRVNPFAPSRLVLTLLVEGLRRIPFLVLLLTVFFAFQLSGAEVGLFVIAATAVALRMSALAAENIRAGFESIHRTQWEAALVMNFSALGALGRVVLPQAWRVILPPSTVHTLSMVKETSLAVQIGFLELTSAARTLNQRGFSALLCYGTVLLLYFVISWSIGRFGRRLEARLATQGATAARPSAILSAAG